MKAQILKSAKVYLLALIVLISDLSAFAQRPPTSGPNPPGPTSPPNTINLAPFVIAGGGLGLAALTRLYIKNRGPKVALTEHLPTYLLNRNILPTPDALNLMYKLNPRLNNTQVIRANQKLTNPDFPEIPKSQINTTSNTVQTTTSMPPGLKEQVNVFKSNLNTFRRTKFTIKANDKNVTIDRINDILKGIEKDITSHENKKEESNTVKSALMKDLFDAVNKTLQKTITTKIIGETETTLLKEIMENLSELLAPTITKKLLPPKSGQIRFLNTAENERMVLASIDLNALFYVQSNHQINVPHDAAANTDDPANTNMLQGFAFAIYKLNANGVPITRGPEVEGQYFIQFALPALKDIPEAYHNISPPLASYATTVLPPSKYYFIVKDYKGNKIPLQDPYIDMKVAFQNPQREKFKDLIIVPIFVP